MADDLDQIEQLAGAVLRSLVSSERRRLLHRMARHLQAKNSARIAANRAPDGANFPKRKDRKPDKPGAYAVKFLYHEGSARRRVLMKSWVHQGPLITGYDVEAGGIRSFFADKITEWLPVDAKDQNKGAGRMPKRRGTIRRRAMFRRLRMARHLKAGIDDQGLWVGFTGRAAAIALIHQEGRLDRPAKNARAIRYAVRELIGFGGGDREELLDLALSVLSSS